VPLWLALAGDRGAGAQRRRAQPGRRDGAPVRLLPLALATVLEDDALVSDFQLLQTGRGACPAARPRRAPRGAGACAALLAYLKRLDLAGIRVNLDTAAPQREPRSGKLRRVVSAIRPAAAG